MTHVRGTEIPGVILLHHRIHQDERGSFGRVFDQLWNEVHEFDIKQVNLSSSRTAGTLRGMHFQTGTAQESKIVTCLAGKIFDVVVDLRKESSTYLKWCGIELSNADGHGLLIPTGCAHGFLTLESDVKLLYLHDNFHDSAREAGINFADPTIGIDWPGNIAVVSSRDQTLPMVDADFVGL